MVRNRQGVGGRSSGLQLHRKRTRRFEGRDSALLPEGLVARPAVPRSKHKTILEWTENTDKKKKLEIEYTTNKNPSANFTFVPVGNPELTSLCKEISREEGALVYIVSTTRERGTIISDHVHRVGYHFRTLVVEQATSILNGEDSVEPGLGRISRRDSMVRPYDIPESQEEINKQADAGIRDLFPRIPNTDREMIIRHAFQKGAVFNGKPVVGVQTDLPLSRRVQLAVIAHIRHTHTRYDLLLRETPWEYARRAVEPLCLDILVKWRGDEETGRDQLDEVLREIVVIDDSEDDDDESEEDTESEEDDSSEEATSPIQEGHTATPLLKKIPAESSISGPTPVQNSTVQKDEHRINGPRPDTSVASRTRSKTKPIQRQRARKGRRGNRRFQAWQDALKRSRQQPSAPRQSLDQILKNDMREANGTPHVMRQSPPTGSWILGISGTHSRDDYQSIFAVDDHVHRPDKCKTLSPPGRMHALSETRYKEKTLKSPLSTNYASAKYSFASDPPSSLHRAIPVRDSRPQQHVMVSGREIAQRDMALPSIEPQTDVTSFTPTFIGNSRPIRHSQVMYKEFEPGRRIVQVEPADSHAIGWEDNQPKRRRVMTMNDPATPQTRSSNVDSYVRLEPDSRAERPLLVSSSIRSVSDVRNDRYLHDMPPVSDNRVENASYAHHLYTNRDRNGILPVTDSRDYVSMDRERRVIIIDDSPPAVRLVRRAPLPGQVHHGDQHEYETRAYSRKPENIEFQGPSRPRPTLLEENSRPLLDPNKAANPGFYTRISASNQLSMANDRSASFSSFPSHSHSHEMNSGLTSYPVLSRVRAEPGSRLSTRNEPMLAGTKSSHHFSQERVPQNFEIVPPDRREATYRPIEAQGTIRIEQSYTPIDARGRLPLIEPKYGAVDSQDRMQGVTRRKQKSDSGLQESNGARPVLHGGGVIVLSP